MHLLTYFRHLDLEKLPPEYILRRWCVDATKYSIFNDEIDQISKGKGSQTQRIHTLKYIFNKIIEEATSKETFDIAEKGMNEIVGKMKQMNVENGDVVSQRDNGSKLCSTLKRRVEIYFLLFAHPLW